MTNKSYPSNSPLRDAYPTDRNSAPLMPNTATLHATGAQLSPLKTLALKVLERNQHCNSVATEEEIGRNLPATLAPLQAFHADRDSTYPGAQLLVKRLVTVPTHSHIRASNRKQIVREMDLYRV